MPSTGEPSTSASQAAASGGDSNRISLIPRCQPPAIFSLVLDVVPPLLEFFPDLFATGSVFPYANG